MVTLHIEHAISDLDTWLDAFSRFEERRRQAGVLDYRVRRPVDDDGYLLIDLTFENAERAAAFHAFLEETVWASRDAAPALVGAPVVRILTAVEVIA